MCSARTIPPRLTIIKHMPKLQLISQGLAIMTASEILDLRDTLGLSQAEFAQLFGVHPMTVSKWERGVLHPTSYQAALMDDFSKASRKRVIKESLKNVLIGAGAVAAIYLLLQATRK